MPRLLPTTPAPLSANMGSIVNPVLSAGDANRVVLQFDAINLPFTGVDRSGGTGRWQVYSRFGLPPLRLFLGRDFDVYRIDGVYDAGKWAGRSPFTFLREHRNRGTVLQFNVQQGRQPLNMPTSPAPYDSIPRQITNSRGIVQTVNRLLVVCTEVSEVGSEYVLTTPQLVRYSLTFEEDFEGSLAGSPTSADTATTGGVDEFGDTFGDSSETITQ